MRRAGLHRAIGIGALWLFLPPRAANGQPSPLSESAEVLFEQGKKLMEAGRSGEACPLFEQSERLEPAPGTQFHLADCYERTGRTASAYNGFLKVAEAARAARRPEHEALAQGRAKRLSATLARIVLVVSANSRQLELDVTCDALAIPAAAWGTAIPVDPGPHTLTAAAPGKVPWRATVEVAPGGATVTIPVPDLADLARAPAEARAPTEAQAGTPNDGGTQRGVGLVAIGVGVAGLGMGSGFGLQSMSKGSDADAHCQGTWCDQEGVTLRDDAIVAGNISTVAFAVGGSILALGAVLWLTAPRPAPSAPAPRVAVGPVGGGMGVLGVW